MRSLRFYRGGCWWFGFWTWTWIWLRIGYWWPLLAQRCMRTGTHLEEGSPPGQRANINTPQTEGADNFQAKEECSWALFVPVVFLFVFGYDWLSSVETLASAGTHELQFSSNKKRAPVEMGGLTISTFSYLLHGVVSVALISCRQQLPWARRLNSPVIWPSLSGLIWLSLSLSIS